MFLYAFFTASNVNLGFIRAYISVDNTDLCPKKSRIKFKLSDFIRDLLGHSSVQTTEIYAKVSSARQRRAIEAASKEIVSEEDALWENSTSIKDWLMGLSAHKVM